MPAGLTGSRPPLDWAPALKLAETRDDRSYDKPAGRLYG